MTVENYMANDSVSKDYVNPKVLAYLEDYCECDSEDILLSTDYELRVDTCDYELSNNTYGNRVLETNAYEVDCYVWSDLDFGFKYYASVILDARHLSYHEED